MTVHPCVPGCFYMTLCLCIPVFTGGYLVMTGFVPGYMLPVLDWCPGLVTVISSQAHSQSNAKIHRKQHQTLSYQDTHTHNKTHKCLSRTSFVPGYLPPVLDWCPGLVRVIISQAHSQANIAIHSKHPWSKFVIKHRYIYALILTYSQKDTPKPF